jgi:hypothetical protein
MKKIKSKMFLIAMVFATLLSCNTAVNTENQKQIFGLWKVKIMKINNEDFTLPNRWIQFNVDSSQASGNGWLQSSVGTWTYQKDLNLLTVQDVEGLINSSDANFYTAPFKVELTKNVMTLKYKNEEKDVIVVLERINKLPTSESNKLFGLWKFESIYIDNKEVSDSLNPEKKAMLSLNWENTYTLYNYPQGEKYGVFKTQGYRNQLEMINYSVSPQFQFYDFNLEGDILVLKSKEKKTELKLFKIDQFPQ